MGSTTAVPSLPPAPTLPTLALPLWPIVDTARLCLHTTDTQSMLSPTLLPTMLLPTPQLFLTQSTTLPLLSTLLLWLTMLCIMLPLLLLTLWPITQLPIMLSMPPLSCPTPSTMPTTLPLLSMPRRPLSLTPTHTVLPMTTPRPTSTPLRPAMPTVSSLDLTRSPFPTVGSRP